MSNNEVNDNSVVDVDNLNNSTEDLVKASANTTVDINTTNVGAIANKDADVGVGDNSTVVELNDVKIENNNASASVVVDDGTNATTSENANIKTENNNNTVIENANVGTKNSSAVVENNNNTPIVTNVAVKKKAEKRISINPNVSQWYIFRVQTGKEDIMVHLLKSSFVSLKKDGIDGEKYFTDFSIPKHKVIKYVNGKKVEKDVNAYPGYVFLKIKLTDEIILFLRRFFKMNGFGQMLPEPISDEAYQKMMDKINNLSKDTEEVSFTIGQRVKVNSGSFASMEGNIYAINQEECKLVISVMIFNCETKIDVTFDQVTPINDNK